MKQEKKTEAILSETRIEVLLREYELCTSEARHMEGLVWTTAGLLGTVSIAGIGFLSGTIPTHAKPYDYLLRVGIALLSLAFIWLWKRMTSRWHSIQRLMFYRIIEIEEELDMYKERYVGYLDKAVEEKILPQSPSINEMIAAMKSKHRPGGARKAVSQMSWILAVVWLVFLVSQIAAMQGWI